MSRTVPAVSPEWPLRLGLSTALTDCGQLGLRKPLEPVLSVAADKLDPGSPPWERRGVSGGFPGRAPKFPAAGGEPNWGASPGPRPGGGGRVGVSQAGPPRAGEGALTSPGARE